VIAPPPIVNRMTTGLEQVTRLISGLNIGHRLFPQLIFPARQS